MAAAAAEPERAVTCRIRDKEVPVTYESACRERLDDILKSGLFLDWCKNFDDNFDVKKVHLQSVDFFGPRVGFIKLKADITNKKGNFCPGICFLRGGAVGVLVILTQQEDGQEFTVLTVQPRAPAGKFALCEIPAGMLDDSGNFAGVAAKEIKEETGLLIQQQDLIDLTKMAYNESFPGIYPSAGGCDEFLRLFLYRGKVSKTVLSRLQGKLTGVYEEGEMIQLKVIPLRDLWKEAPDAKALSALCLYENLVATGKLERDPPRS
eukprot:CAMPEP_0114561000 /NCGR_PEP_ID=MMETSP0114-20121206/11768_1 /TAXON_ID=31324 /ORGANISM="Goniomonas sp, Strain m" /LENGTH=263 /DNA_ID=CAMNT_0001746601 /DNA_START=18 /DNA_END=809 /DNA_ORIENTATION=+